MSATRKLYHDRQPSELQVGEAIYLRNAEEFLGGWERLWNVAEFCLPCYDAKLPEDMAYWLQAKPRPSMSYMRFLKTIVRTDEGSTVWVWQRTS